MYNTAPYLRRCLDSVCGQTLREIEIICVNDASTDNCLDILKEYAALDIRICIHDMGYNRGTSVAKNTGIIASTGEYIGFVDSDDAIALDFFQKLYDVTLKTTADIIKGVRIRIEEDGTSKHEFINDKVRLNKYNFTYQHTTAIYLRRLIVENKIIFPDGITNNEDIVFLIKSVYYAKDLITVDDSFYYYMRRPGSMASARYNNFQTISLIKSLHLIVDFINEIKLSKEEYLYIFYRQLNYAMHLHTKIENTFVFPYCAESLLALYHKCRFNVAINERLATEYPVCRALLLSDDLYGLTGYLSKYDTTGKIMAANLRARVNARVE